MRQQSTSNNEIEEFKTSSRQYQEKYWVAANVKAWLWNEQMKRSGGERLGWEARLQGTLSTMTNNGIPARVDNTAMKINAKSLLQMTTGFDDTSE